MKDTVSSLMVSREEWCHSPEDVNLVCITSVWSCLSSGEFLDPSNQPGPLLPLPCAHGPFPLYNSNWQIINKPFLLQHLRPGGSREKKQICHRLDFKGDKREVKHTSEHGAHAWEPRVGQVSSNVWCMRGNLCSDMCIFLGPIKINVCQCSTYLFLGIWLIKLRAGKSCILFV